jgi:hypothetical protein
LGSLVPAEGEVKEALGVFSAVANVIPPGVPVPDEGRLSWLLSGASRTHA